MTRAALLVPLLLLAACQSDRAARKEAPPAAPDDGSCAAAFPASLFPGRLGALERREQRSLGEGGGRFYAYRRALENGELELTAIVLPADRSATLEQAFDLSVQQSIDADREALERDPKLLYQKEVKRSGRLARGRLGRVLSTPRGDPLAPSTIADHYLFEARGCLLSLRVAYPTAREKTLAPEIEAILSALQ